MSIKEYEEGWTETRIKTYNESMVSIKKLTGKLKSINHEVKKYKNKCKSKKHHKDDKIKLEKFIKSKSEVEAELKSSFGNLKDYYSEFDINEQNNANIKVLKGYYHGSWGYNRTRYATTTRGLDESILDNFGLGSNLFISDLNIENELYEEIWEKLKIWLTLTSKHSEWT